MNVFQMMHVHIGTLHTMYVHIAVLVGIRSIPSFFFIPFHRKMGCIFNLFNTHTYMSTLYEVIRITCKLLFGMKQRISIIIYLLGLSLRHVG